MLVYWSIHFWNLNYYNSSKCKHFDVKSVYLTKRHVKIVYLHAFKSLKEEGIVVYDKALQWHKN